MVGIDRPNALIDSEEFRQSIIDACRWMNRAGINQETSGNISVRVEGGDMLITPSGVPYDEMQPDMICGVPLESDADASSRTTER